MKKYLLLLFSVLLCLLIFYLINRYSHYYISPENFYDYLKVIIFPVFLSIIVALFVYTKNYYWNRLVPSLTISYLITFMFLIVYFFDSYIEKQKVIEKQSLEAKNDIKKGIIKKKLGTGLIMIDENYEKRHSAIDSLERNKYGFFTESTGCMIFEEDSYYNEAVDEYLQIRNGKNWKNQYKKDINLILKKYPYKELKR